jgi:hypothetical protein
VKVTVVVNEAGEVIAAHVPVASERGPDSYRDDAPTTGFMPSEGQEVLDLDLPEEDAPGEPPADFLETLQRHKDRGSSKASA